MKPPRPCSGSTLPFDLKFINIYKYTHFFRNNLMNLHNDFIFILNFHLNNCWMYLLIFANFKKLTQNMSNRYIVLFLFFFFI